MSEWISVKDRLPIEDCIKKVFGTGWLVYRPKAKSRPVYIEYLHPDYWENDIGTSTEITHWMPLPEPPKDKPNHEGFVPGLEGLINTGGVTAYHA